jgi:ABC-type Mn2+/Zn2+ transport system permease subunit
VIDFILDPLSYEFIQRGLIAAVIVGITCGIIGCYVVLKSLAFMGDALAHAILPGVAIAYLLSINLLIGALVAAFLVALGIGFVSRRGDFREDTAIGILFAGSLALGVALISSIKTYAVDLNHILFGNVLGVSPGSLVLVAILSGVVILTIVILYRPFLLITFDAILARTLYLPVDGLRYLLLILLAITIVVSLQTVGIGLVTALLVTPAATAYLVARRLPAMMAIAAAIGALSGIMGIYISYYWEISAGASIVLVATLIFFIVFMLAPQKGLVWQRRRK